MVRSFALAVSVGLASSTRLQIVEKKQHHLRDDWVIEEKAHGGEKHEVSIAVKQRNLDLLHDKLMEVSSPDSSQRGQYLSWDEAQGLTANPNATAAILAWLDGHGVQVDSVHKHGHYIKAKTSVSTWEQVLNTSFSRMRRVDSPATTNSVLRATTDVSLPEKIAELVEGIFMTTQIPPPMRPPPQYVYKGSMEEGFLKQSSADEPANSVNPAKIKDYYKVTGTGSKNVNQAVFESLNQVASPSDLNQFQNRFNLPSQSIAVDKGQHVQDFTCQYLPNDCAEANLDVQYMMAMSSGTPLTYWYDSNLQTPFEDWITNLAADPSPPLVNSLSYGAPEPKMSKSVMDTFNIEAMKLGLQGVTIFVSSGDDGVAGTEARTGASNCGYTPSFPATSPYVTAVGATQGGPTGGEEVACSGSTGGSITTGGGFSTAFTAPDWQASAVEKFLSIDDSAVEGYNRAGRAYPDLAMAGFNYEVVIGGSIYMVSGTSASAPVVAGMATLVNSRLSEQGKPSIGFINPTLYSVNNSNVFNDIVRGNNKCAAAGSNGAVCCLQGFNAVEGWDATTGWGTVRFDEFSKMFGGGAAGRAFHSAIWFLILGVCLRR